MPKWLDEFKPPKPERTVNGNPLYVVKDENDIRLTFFQFKLVRNHDVHSYLHSLIIKKNIKLCIAVGNCICRRVLSGSHQLVSVLVTEKLLDEFEDLLSRRTFLEGIFVCSSDTFRKVVGLKENTRNEVAILVNFKVAERIYFGLQRPSFPIFNSSNLLRERKSIWENNLDCYIDSHVELNRISPPFIILDDIISADNVGLIARTSFCFGVLDWIVTRRTFASISTRSLKSSCGALIFLRVHVTDSLIDTIETLKANNIEVLATTPSSDQELKCLNHDKWALILGNEKEGSSAEILNSASQKIKIPQRNGDSLSVSVAAGICIFELSKTTSL